MRNLLILLLLASLTSADCTSGYLEILNVGDRTSGETVIIVTRTNVSLENSTQVRNIDLYLQDSYTNTLGIIRTQFSNTNLETSIESRVLTSNQMLNSTYRVKADLQVVNSSNTTQVVCSQMAYSNWFKIKTDREHYSHSPFEFDISTYFPVQEYRYYERKCLENEGRCIELNVSGELPANFTMMPSLIWHTENKSTSYNVTYVSGETYSGGHLLALSSNLSQCTNSLSFCNTNLGNESIRSEMHYSKTQELNAKIDSANSDYKRVSQEYLDYKTKYPYGFMDIVTFGIPSGIILVVAIMFFYNRKTTTETPHDGK